MDPDPDNLECPDPVYPNLALQLLRQEQTQESRNRSFVFKTCNKPWFLYSTVTQNTTRTCELVLCKNQI